ncbi:hypothetical protein HLK59_21215 [Streptomyces sp. S3(2020)]|nr:hypothetical protein [Streptomyces sp. S3(2020)]
MLSCVGHRVMVPPHRGTRRTRRPPRCVRFAGQVRYKGKSWTHSHRLWCPDVPWEKLRAYKSTCTAASRRTVGTA